MYTPARPLAIFIVARVTINGGIVVFEITRPLNAPETTPITTPTISATGILIPFLDTNPAEITPVSAITEPTDKSMPPSIITIVIPHARSILVEICLNTFSIFFTVGKVPLVPGKIDRNMHRITKATIIPIFSLKNTATWLADTALLLDVTIFLSSILFTSVFRLLQDA